MEDPTPQADTRELLLELFNSGQITHEEYERRLVGLERRQLRIADWVNAYMQTPAAQAEMNARARERLGMEMAWTAANLPAVPVHWSDGVRWMQRSAPLRIEPGQVVAVPGRIVALDDGGFELTPLVPAPVGDDVNELTRIMLNQAWTEGYPTYVAEPAEPNSGHSRDQVDAYRYAMAELMGRRLHETMVGALADPDPMTAGHGDGPCGLVVCQAPQCRRANPAVPANDALTATTLREAVRTLSAADVRNRPVYHDGLMTRDEYRRLYQQEWLPSMNDEEQAEYDRAVREHAEQQRRAKARAEGLLLEHLTPEQRETWREHEWVEVKGSRSGRTYRIKYGTSMNIDCPEAGWTYCAAPANAHETPTEDVVLAQVLWLTCDEDGFLAKANRSIYTGPGWVDRRMGRNRPLSDFLRVGRPVDGPGRPFLAQGLQDYDLAYAPNLAPYLRERPDRTGVAAHVPDACVTRGCTVEIVQQNPWGERTVRHNGDVVMRLADVARSISGREIRRYLEQRLAHVAA